MPFFDDTAKKYMVVGNDWIDWNRLPLKHRNAQRGDTIPAMCTETQLQGHQVEAYYNGASYISRLAREMAFLESNPTDGILWIHGWYFQVLAHKSIMRFGVDQSLPEALRIWDETNQFALYHEGPDLGMGGRFNFLQKLANLENAGVDVRVIGWVTPILAQTKGLLTLMNGLGSPKTVNGQQYDRPLSMFERNVATIYNLLMLRGMIQPDRVIFNTLCHPLGGAHSKMIIAGNNNYLRAFTGGVDIAASRNQVNWPDATLEVEGNAALKAANFFKSLWNEIAATTATNINFEAEDAATNAVQVARADFPTHLGHTINTNLTAKPISANVNTANKYVQMFTTLPRKYYAAHPPHYRHKAVATAISAVKHISPAKANRFVNALVQEARYFTPPLNMAPQGSFEFKSVIFKAIMNAQKYIFIMDQDASSMEFMNYINARIKELRRTNVFLRVVMCTPYEGVEDTRSGQEFKTTDKEFKMFKAMANGIPKDQWSKHFLWVNVGVHSKVVLIDDVWISIGSANFMRRSMYTDIEMGMAVCHETWVKAQRNAIWSQFLVNSRAAIPDDTEYAVGIWFNDIQLDLNNPTDYSDLTLDWGLRYGRPRGGNKGKEGFGAKYLAMAEDPDSNMEI